MSATDQNQKIAAPSKLLRSGMLFTVISFATSMGAFVFQGVISRQLKDAGDYGAANSAIGAFVPLMSLLPAAAAIAITHYIAHYQSCGDAARLQGLLLGCRKFLFRLTVLGSLLALAVILPLSSFFHYNESMMLATLISTLLGLWSGLATALVQGLGWFNRLALIGFLSMLLRVVFCWLGMVTWHWPSAEMAVLASALSLFAGLVLLCWRKELKLHGKPISPWNREFVHYFIASVAFAVGNYCFFMCDALVAQHYFPGAQCDAFSAVGVLARALPVTIAPLLAVLFTSRSSGRSHGSLSDQLTLLGLSALGLVSGAAGLYFLRTFCLHVIGRNTPEAAANIAPFALTMVFVGLLQSLAFWSLASRWLKICLLYGGLGLGYWITLLGFGKTPAELLRAMPVTAAAALAVMFIAWFSSMKRHKLIA